MNRELMILNVKKFDDDAREFSGVATTPDPDRAGDVIEPLGAKFKNPIPLLAGHDHRSPIGTVFLDKPTAKGITFTAKIAKSAEPLVLKERLDTAWAEIKAGLIRAVSIGFTADPSQVENLKTGGRRFKSFEILELSSVVVPMNAGAVINEVRAFVKAQVTDPDNPEDDAENGDSEDQDETDGADGDGSPSNRENDKAAASGKGRVVRLDTPDRVRSPPFHIRTLHRERRSGLEPDNAQDPGGATGRL